MIKPNVIVCNLPIPGSSAIDSILREIFTVSGYFITPFGSKGSHSLLSDLDEGKVSSPFYHWSDRSISCFDDLLAIKIASSYTYTVIREMPRYHGLIS